MEPKPFRIFSLSVAHKLGKKGFVCVGKKINVEKPHLYVYLFEDTPEFREALTEITEEGKRPHGDE